MWVNWKNLLKEKNFNGVFLLPTDTVYGLHAKVDDLKSIEKIYLLKRRKKDKTFIVLISSLKDLKKFGVELNLRQKKFLKKVWPGRVTVILKHHSKYHYLACKGKIAFRLPPKKELRLFLKKTGPLISTSANLSGQVVLKDLNDLPPVWEDEIDFIVKERGYKSGESSVILDIVRW